MNSVVDYVTLISAILVTILVLIQSRSASLGAGFGGGPETEFVRRGTDKTIHHITIALVLVFCLSLLVGLLL